MTATAPTAPGRLGAQIEPQVLLTYLTDLGEWVRVRREELTKIDQAALASKRRDELSSDLVLSMALWKAVSDRMAQMETVWDGGRVGTTERERLSVLIWGRLEPDKDLATPAGVALSLPEACRLSDALASQLAERLTLSPDAGDMARRVRELRAQLDRLRDQVGLEPQETRAEVKRNVQRLATRVEDVAARLERGGDIGGMIGPLENDAARTERDLIVGGVRRRELRSAVAAAEQRLTELSAREDKLTELAAAAVQAVTPAPRYAVPDVSVLGPVPTTTEALAAYTARLERVGQAMDIAEQRYAAALAERQDLAEQLDAFTLKASALGVADQPDCAAARAAAAAVLDRRPAPVAVARHLVAAYLAWVDQAAAERAPSPRREDHR